MFQKPQEPQGKEFSKEERETYERKLRLSFGLFEMAFAMKRYQLKRTHPELSDRELNHKTYALFETDR